MEFIMNLVQGVTAVIATASIVAAVTPTPQDDKWIAKMYAILDLAAMNVGFAKDKAKK